MGASPSAPACSIDAAAPAGLSGEEAPAPPVEPGAGGEASTPLPVVLGGGRKHQASPEVVKKQASLRSAPGRLEPSCTGGGGDGGAGPPRPPVEAEAATPEDSAGGKPGGCNGAPPAKCCQLRRACSYEKRRLLVPQHALAAAQTPKGPLCCLASSGSMLKNLMRGRKTDWKRARRAASQISSPDYSCHDFYEDVIHAFPELDLYLAGDTTSGRDGEDEYQRTLGAMFAFFWLMRLPLDGSESFCYGLDESWRPREGPRDKGEEAQAEWAKRRAFHEDTEWAALHSLLADAGLLVRGAEEAGADEVTRRKSFLAASSRRRDELARRHNTDRILAMLVLTAIHDIMKTVPLLPKVSKKHGPFRGYQIGEVVNDHDAALAYILEFYPSLLPSFAGLPKAQQESIKFTQSKMEYNMGWLVQAEAPPGALLRKFKQVVSSGQANQQDVAFYFTHWFTDLAGAEPYPQEGCEKFVLRFPKAVLNQFLLSFSIVQRIGLPGATETRILEDYLTWRWDSHTPSLGPAPQGQGAIAKMRLVTMAQGDSARVLSSFDSLPESDRQVLSKELSMTGCRDQAFWRENANGNTSTSEGPAILIYYAPALMQKAGREDPLGALRLLAEVFRQGRALWPLTPAAADDTVTVRVDMLKELCVGGIVNSQASWVLTKLTSRDGAVRSVPPEEARQASASQRVLWFLSQPAALDDEPKKQESSGSTTCTDGSK